MGLCGNLALPMYSNHEWKYPIHKAFKKRTIMTANPRQMCFFFVHRGTAGHPVALIVLLLPFLSRVASAFFT